MKITRRYTKAGHSPYEGIDFEERTTHLDGKEGQVLYHADAVIFPTSWSQIATDIVAQKYFRRKDVNHNHPNSLYNSPHSKKWAPVFDPMQPVHPEGTEFDIRQVIHRMVGCWTYWGAKEGYFDSKKDARAFYDELSYMLVTQMWAPNSPQWFNTGLHWAYGIEGVAQGHYFCDPQTGEAQPSTNAYEHIQAHACFILSIKDDLVNDGGIFDLFTREARIFKLGSGSGTNYSNIRGENEPLSGGGRSSGLMSFLPVGDRGAGAIKSGGTTRRAARMAILDVDHPDIEKFIDWKVEEERKVVALTVGSIAMKKFWDEIRAEKADVKSAIRSARRSGIPSAFIAQCLARLEQNDRADDLKSYDTSWEGEGYQSVSGMNANNTVRVTDEFMMKATGTGKKGSIWRKWDLVNRTGGTGAAPQRVVAKTVDAKELFDRINSASYMCGDPGLQFDTTINDWHTTPKSGRINASNPCSEFMYLDNTSCNLASTNLVKFWNQEEEPGFNFDMVGFDHVNRLVTIVLEISVAMAQFPSIEIAENSWRYRPLGLGYANLGALLMRIGVPYDSEEGRNWAAAITAAMTATAYKASAHMAITHGPFAGFEENKNDMLRVMRNHRAAALNDAAGYDGINCIPHPLKDGGQVPRGASEELRIFARNTWKEVVTLGTEWGFRNAQATVLAPTGTIGLAMDCDTTGVECDFALVKYKKLAGGGYMKIVNQSVAPALHNLNYTETAIKDILAHIENTGTIERAPHLLADHLAVFDCAQKAGTGTRFIRPEGHVLMMAACQPFLSGAISKTVNLPDDATIGSIGEIHKLAWKSGVKAIALYRNGSKMSQALATNMALLDGSEADVLEDPKATQSAKVKVLATALARGFRKRLPDACRGLRQKAKIGNHTLYLHTGEYEDGTLGEVFVDISREGATLRSLLNNFAIAISLGLQYGVPLDEFADAFCFTRFEPAGFVQGSKYIKKADSIIDYIFRELAVGYLGRFELAHVPPEVKADVPSDAVVEKQVDQRSQAVAMGFTGNACSNCGSFEMVRSGTCERCGACGTTTGCS